MAQSNLNRTFLDIINKEDYRDLFDGIKLLTSSLTSPKPKSIAAIKRLLGIRLSIPELIMELKDPTSQTHKYCSEIVLTFMNMLENKHLFIVQLQAQKNEEQKELEDIELAEEIKIEEFERYRAEIIRTIQLKEILIREFLEQYRHTKFQSLQLQKMHELAFFLAITTNERSRAIIFNFINKLYYWREKNAARVERLRARLSSEELTPRQRRLIEEAIKKYEEFEATFNTEMRLRVMIRYLDDPEGLREQVEYFEGVERGKKRKLKIKEQLAKEHHLTTSTEIANLLETEINIEKYTTEDLCRNLYKVLGNSQLVDFHPEVQNDIIKIISKLNKINSSNSSQKQDLKNLVKNLALKVKDEESFVNTTQYLNQWLTANNQEEKIDLSLNKKDVDKVSISRPSPEDTVREISEINMESIENKKSLPKSFLLSCQDREQLLSLKEELETLKSAELSVDAHRQIKYFLSLIDSLRNDKIDADNVNVLVSAYNRLVKNYSKEIDLEIIESIFASMAFIDGDKLEQITNEDDPNPKSLT